MTDDSNSTTTFGNDSTDSSDHDHADPHGALTVRARTTATERDAGDRDRALDGVPAPAADVTLTVQVPPAACRRIAEHLANTGDGADREVVLDHLDAQVNLQQQYRTADSTDAVEAILAGGDRAESVEDLSIHHRILLAIIQTDGSVDATTLHERYDRRAPTVLKGRLATPVSRRERRRLLTELRDDGLVKMSGQGRGTRYRISEAASLPAPEDYLEEPTPIVEAGTDAEGEHE